MKAQIDIEMQLRVSQLEQELSTLKAENERLKELVMFDQLTKVFNRRTFDESLKREWRRAARHSNPITLLLVDIDHFKRINDEYGHLEGDRTLRKVARAIAGMPSRAADIVARYGGEEFAVLLPDTTGEGAFKLAEKIRKQVSKTAGVTVSIGVASLTPVPGFKQELLISLADGALYQAKRNGRDQTVTASQAAIASNINN